MHVNPFEFGASGAAEKKQEAPAGGEDPSPMRAAPPRDADERRGEDTPEEPGYGHGV